MHLSTSVVETWRIKSWWISICRGAPSITINLFVIWNHDSLMRSVLDLIFTVNDCLLLRVDEAPLPNLVVPGHHCEILSPCDATSGPFPSRLHWDLYSENQWRSESSMPNFVELRSVRSAIEITPFMLLKVSRQSFCSGFVYVIRFASSIFFHIRFYI